ncbi:ThiF family adenylyltransferase [Pedobacter endophyticus]|uniref:ThiF family adenylyltransferase n=1 Tax=Pedobacter endophyticus TaxID=2789740 RepID=A0A7S9PZV9_9SPHI|nr:ThiF family adenylyltransferase [Pedobacter endophyticus]QPH40101.1 ThiF family adenylyltransferase [Pedobacter endophyticus]
MEAEKFSNSLPDFTGEIVNPALQDSLLYLKNVLGDKFVIKEWDEYRIAVPVDIAVELPSLGNKDGIDISPSEPVIFTFSLRHYPAFSPTVLTDRLDFPKDKLAHLYIAKNGRPPAFCYVRGDSNEWYANKRINDLLIRIGNWLRDAATGELTENGDQFEPLRLEGYEDTIIYDYDRFAETVLQDKALIPGEHYSIALFERIKDGESSTYKFQKFVTMTNALKVIQEVDLEKKKDKKALDRKQYHFGYVLWSGDDTTYKNYEIEFPEDWEGFKLFCNNFGIDHSKFEDMVATGDANYFVHFPVILGIKRPSTLVGYSSTVEFVNFRFWVDTTDVSDGKIINNIPVKIQSHNQPLTTAKARAISGDENEWKERNVVFGCGALGSKVVMHFTRGGQTNLTLIDPDHISPHNLVRHALFADDEGNNKASALSAKITKMYPMGSVRTISGPSFKDDVFEKEETFKNYGWAMDFTASDAFFNKITVASNMGALKIASGGISDFGNLGILLKEGANRNPRIDDLQAALYSTYKTDQKISDWLRREQLATSNGNLIVQVGIGCNSETTVLSDDKISSHSAYFAGVLKGQIPKDVQTGKVYLNRIIGDEDYNIETSVLNVDPFDIIAAKNDASWSVRFKSGILEQIKLEAKKAKRKETGGVFVGIINYKTKTIHVTDLISAPPDSKANSICFYRGYSGLPEEIKNVTEGAGGQLGYIGEWHSHPDGPNGLSSVDMNSIYRFKDEFSGLVTPLPVFLTVVAPAGILPFVF